ncbi:c-type cytochrome [Roseovarius aestuariivivens]|uniref:c-type cytochrome n=1 Tax=Roseovarius aestuariivivens TaxID=1888910 RepID=UPI00108114CC|nr:c-type cytochrome [Roseovarius aestuariivivens]
MFFKSLTTCFATMTLCATAAMADDLGKTEYMNACASCHGASGVGDGPLAELMTVTVPSLTTLSANNDGTFPMLEVIQTIDGRQGTRGHGYPMPIWGDRFKASAGDIGPMAAETIVRGKVLSIAYYLESIQE